MIKHQEKIGKIIMKITRCDTLQIISGLWLAAAVAFIIVLPVIYVCAACLPAFIFALVSLISQKTILQKRQKILGIVELSLSGLLFLFVIGLDVRYAFRIVSQQKK